MAMKASGSDLCLDELLMVCQGRGLESVESEVQ